jgi:GIY-YIG catalytic domain
MKRWTVYCHMHIETNRCYVGITCKTMMHRWNQHVAQAKSTKGGRWHFPNAIRKYGKDAFSHQILEICDSLEKANYREEAWIELFETRDPQFGFNLAKGGAHIPHMIRKNPWDDPEFRAKQMIRIRSVENIVNSTILLNSVRAASIAAHNTPDSRAKRSLSSKEMRARPEIKEKMSFISKEIRSRPEVKEKMLAAQTGRVLSQETRDKISKAARQAWKDPDVRLKIIASKIGRKLTKESISKRTETRKKLRETR